MLAQKENANPHKKKGQGNGSRRTKHSSTQLCCWTHSACSHTSNDYKFKMVGYQDDATFKDRKGGSACRCVKKSMLKQIEDS